MLEVFNKPKQTQARTRNLRVERAISKSKSVRFAYGFFAPENRYSNTFVKWLAVALGIGVLFSGFDITYNKTKRFREERLLSVFAFACPDNSPRSFDCSSGPRSVTMDYFGDDFVAFFHFLYEIPIPSSFVTV